jgi:RNA polymerase sigma-70 factor (ECF subfamily)
MATEDTPSSDFELLTQWRDGAEEAGRELFGRYFDSVYRFFRNKVDEAAEDLTQQTFMGMVQGKDRFRGDSSFRTYLFMIARKKLYSYLRQGQRRAEPVRFDSTSVADLGLVSPSRAVADRQEHQLLLQALRRLPVEMQVALELFYWEELTVSEIAEVLEAPVGTVKSRLQRARARLDGVIAELSQSEALLRSTVDNFDLWARQLQDHMKRPPDASELEDDPEEGK